MRIEHDLPAACERAFSSDCTARPVSCPAPHTRIIVLVHQRERKMAFGCLGRSRPEAGPSLLVAQLWYGLYFAYNACVSPYLTVYLRSLGLAEGLVGVLAFVRPLCSLLGAPLLCAMADASRKHALILQLTVLASVLLRAGVCCVVCPCALENTGWMHVRFFRAGSPFRWTTGHF